MFSKSIDTLDFVKNIYLYWANEFENHEIVLIEKKVDEYIQIIEDFHDTPKNNNAYKPLLYEPSPTSGKSIQICYTS